MKLDAWQVRMVVLVLKAGILARRLPALSSDPDDRAARDLDRQTLEAMVRALESGESLEAGS